jgi:hypothetical protein
LSSKPSACNGSASLSSLRPGVRFPNITVGGCVAPSVDEKGPFKFGGDRARPLNEC